MIHIWSKLSYESQDTLWPISCDWKIIPNYNRIFDAKAFHFKYHGIIPYLDNTAFHTEISIISYSVQKKYFAFSLQKILSKIRWNNRPFKISHWPFRSNHKDLFLIETAVNWSLIVHFQLQRHACNKSQMKMLSNRSAK